MAQLNFNVEDAGNDDELIPNGDYTCHIIASEMKETKSGGMMLAIRVQVLDDPYRGRLLFENFNLVNDNETAVKIAQRQLAQLCKACGLMEVEDSEELHNIEFTARIGTNPAKGDFPESNSVKKYSSAD